MVMPMRRLLLATLILTTTSVAAAAQYPYFYTPPPYFYAPSPYPPAPVYSPAQAYPPSWSYNPYTSGAAPCPQGFPGELGKCQDRMPPTYGQPSYWPVR